MTLGCRRLTQPPFRHGRRLWAAAHTPDVHAERGREVDLMILILREVLAHLFGELGVANSVPAVWLYRTRRHEKVVQADYHWGRGFFAEIEGCDIAPGAPRREMVCQVPNNMYGRSLRRKSNFGTEWPVGLTEATQGGIVPQNDRLRPIIFWRSFQIDAAVRSPNEAR
jgi:hypothetical protein